MYKPFDLTGKVALVTGGNGGIGLGMAEALAASCARGSVVIWGTNEAKNESAVTALKAHGKRVAARKVNVANEKRSHRGHEGGNRGIRPGSTAWSPMPASAAARRSPT